MNFPAATKAPGRNDPCWCGSGKKYKKCHLATREEAAPSPRKTGDTLIKTEAQIAAIKRACQLTCDILDMLETRIVPNISTETINDWVHDYTLAHGGIPAPLNYRGFPKSVCTSVNEEVCHGIPGERILAEGDIINVDVTTILDGYYGDSSRMFAVGEISPEARALIQTTHQCLELGIAQVRPGGRVGDIGHAIQTHAEERGYSVVRDFVGHGTGLRFHESPQIPHFGRKGHGHPLLEGMVFTIEPMINQGDWAVRILSDNWTAITCDGLLSAQFEHTVVVRSNGVEVLTI